MPAPPSPSRLRAAATAPRAVALLVLAAALGIGPGAPPRAEADPSPATPGMILNLLSRPVESREAAMREAVREEARAPRPAAGDEVRETLPDGSVRVRRGPVTITVKDPCLPLGGDLPVRPLGGRALR